MQKLLCSQSIWKDRIAWTAPRFEAGMSSRPAIAVVVGCDDDLHITTQRGRLYAGRALLVAPNLSRCLRSTQGLYTLNLDPVHRICRHLRNVTLNGNEVLDLSSALNESLLAQLRLAVAKPQNCAEGYRISEQLLNTLFPDTQALAPIDPRVDLAATWLHTHLPQQVDLAQLTALCRLSTSRLVHLFTQELGISPRRYLLWAKMRRVTAYLPTDEQSLTDIAYSVGFADSAHMSRTLKKYFALTPSFLGSKFQVKTAICDGMCKR